MKKSDSLRERAEKDTQNAKVKSNTPESTAELVHELQVHQTELEIQNEELIDAQEELSELYNQYRELYDEAPVGYFSLDGIGNIRNVNIKGAELLGLEKNRIIGFGFIRFIPLNCQTKYYNSLKAAIVNSKIQEVELQLKRKKSLFYVQMQIMQIHNKPDEKYRIIITDITERKKTEEELKGSEEKFKSLIKNLPVGISILDKERKILYDNPALENILELSKEDLNKEKHVKRKYIKSNMTEMPSNELPSVKAFNEQKPVEDVEIGVIKEDKSIIWTNVSAIPLSFPDWKVLVVTSNITRRKKLEDDLRQAHNNLEEQVKERTAELQTERDNLNSILNTTKSGVYIVNSDYGLEYVNPIIKKDFGLVKGQKCYEYFYNENSVCSNCKIQEAFEGNIIEWEQHSSKSGKTYDVLATPIKVNGSISVLVFLYDVTRREKAEKQLKEAISELKRSNKELQQFAYVSSHDLQEPLRTIASFTQLLQRRYEGKFDSDADEFMEYIVEATIRMKAQIEGLLEYSRVGTQGGEFKPVDINQILKSTINVLNSSIEESKAKITFDELPTIMGDDNQLQRVFQNLISNAIRFRKPEEPLKIHISSNKDKENKEYVFSIIDNGIGIEEQYSERIFTIFQRLHTREVYKGTGIGLSIVKRIIERHGGHVWVESEFGVGSTFYFTIPIQKIS